MGLQAKLSQDGNEVTIDIPERFDFSVRTEFRKAYQDHSNAKKYIINVRDTRYMNGSALGMLLQLHEHLGGDLSAIRIINASDYVKTILDAGSFHQLMQID